MAKPFANEDELLRVTPDALERLAVSQRGLKDEVMKVVEPMARANERRKVFEAFGQSLHGLAGGPFDIARRSLLAECEARLDADPQKRAWIRAAALVSGGAPKSVWGENEFAFARSLKARSLTTGDSSLGAATTGAIPVSEDVYSLLLRYGAFRTLGVVPLQTGKTKLASITGKASAVWLTPALQGAAIPADASISFASISPEAATVATLIEVSGEAVMDGKITFEAAILAAIVEGLSYRLDWSAFVADGTADTDDGGMTGIFSDATVPVANASATHTTVATTTLPDWTRCLSSVTPSALQRDCRWWISPILLPKILALKDSGEPLLKPPTAAGDAWMLIGFPVTWVAVAPSTDSASQKIAAFGCGDAYTVALRQDFEIMSSDHKGFASNLRQIRAIARARCMMRDATSLAVLKLAAA